MKKEEGFTLVELLIVIAIIGILAAIAIPQFNKYRANAMLSNVQQFAKTLSDQAISLASTAGQNPECVSEANFYVQFIDNGNEGYLEAHKGSISGALCDRVKVYDKKPEWLNATETKLSDGSNNYVVLQLVNGTSVTFSNGLGYAQVTSTYNLGGFTLGCKYYNDNSTFEDISSSIKCRIQ